MVWDRYKSLIYVVLLTVLGGLGAKTYWNRHVQSKQDDEWAGLATSIGLETAYVDQSKAIEGLSERIAGIDVATLKAGAEKASATHQPFLLLAVACKSIQDKDWDGAEAALKQLETKFPQHVLVRSSSHPVQTQDVIRDKEPAKPQAKPKKPEYKPVVAGSAVSMMRAQVAAAKGYTPPPQFAKVEVPANAPKIKFEFGDHGSVTIALMEAHAKQTCAKVLELASAQDPIWVGLAVDEIQRPTKTIKQPRQLHFGLASTKEDDRTKWKATEPSTNLVEFENNSLSHFPGAVSARIEADGKSGADRLWIAVDDASTNDGERVIFGYVVEGLDNLKKICDAPMSESQEEDRGQGRPADLFRITKVTVIKP